jgi:16S rRNA (adenine1518-N6/adenine1519-N6)-dimethyltransferase
MSLSETKRLLRKYQIVPRRLLGQNFLIDPSIFPKLSDYASLEKSDVVLDVGAGFGFLTVFLSDKCKMVLAVEKDPKIVEALRERLEDLSNVCVLEGDIMQVELPRFNKLISIPPYYISSRLATWLLKREFECAVLILQKEFANRLVAPTGSRSYGWLTVITYLNAYAELLDAVPKTIFYPEPEVDSVILRLKPRKTLAFEVANEFFFQHMVRWLFTQRNKKLGNALKPFIKNSFSVGDEEAKKKVLSLPFREKRVMEIAPEDFGETANVLVG